MNSLSLFKLLVTISLNVSGDTDVETVEATCKYHEDLCVVDDTDYRLSKPNNLNIINADANKVILFFEMTKQHYEVMPLNIFQLFPKLVTLQISTGLEAIAKVNFNGASDLETLILSKNKISAIEAHTFEGLDKLEIISLDENKLTKIESNAFAGAISLRNLYLNGNDIETIEDGAFDIPTLQEIDLSNNFLQTLLDGTFIGCSNLNTLYLSRNDLTRLGKSFNSLPNLSRLFFDNYYTKITDFDFYANARRPQLRQFEPRCVELVLDDPVSAANDIYAAERLDISGNNLSYPDILHRLRNFRYVQFLLIGNNNFTTINDLEKIEGMFPRLIELDFRNIPCKKEVIDRLSAKFGSDKVGDFSISFL